ncbi:MAG: hypothetical protein IKJ39_12105 [Lachnospiraceae bacterium]|nr:hypothetical protein [Lachnospiraceae bacterium]
MIKQIRLLTKLEMCNFWGINVLLHTADKKAKRKAILMAVIYGLVGLVIMGYVCGLCYGLHTLDAAEAIPAYLITITTVFVLVLSIFKAGGILYRKQGYELVSSMPIRSVALVCGRFFRLYFEGLVFTALIMIPGLVMYGYFTTPKVSFLLIGGMAVLTVPLIPVAVSAGIGMIVTGISQRMKHKAWMEAGLTILLVVVVFMLPMTSLGEAEITPEMMKNYGDGVLVILGNLYPPAVLLGDAITEGSMGKLALVLTGSLLLLGIVIVLITIGYQGICMRLFNIRAKHDYQKEKLHRNSLHKALVIREARRYFSSGVYVMNTIMGPIMAVILSISFFFIDMEEMVADLPAGMNLRAAFPFVLGAVFTVLSVTSVSISMEGKEVWILKSLPLSRKEILDGKILFQLCLTAPFYVVSVIISCMVLKLPVAELIAMVVLPAIMILFAAVLGISVNLWLPKMQWDTEVSVVKQSASAMIGGLVPVLVSGICAVVIMIVPINYTGLGYWGISLVILTVTGVLYRRNVLK